MRQADGKRIRIFADYFFEKKFDTFDCRHFQQSFRSVHPEVPLHPSISKIENNWTTTGWKPVGSTVG
jgi:hypothetical protein